ncbi:MAG: arsenate reductase family protein [Leeuwenhoekiella sp.]
MLKIYHNPRCRKSREGLKYLEATGKEFEVIQYMKNPLSYMTVAALVGKTKLEPLQMVRTQEKIWKEQYKDKSLSKEDIIEALSHHPQLLQRPIVVKDNKAVVAQPPENINFIF